MRLAQIADTRGLGDERESRRPILSGRRLSVQEL